MLGAAAHGIDAERAGASENEIEEQEAIEDRGITAIVHGVEIAWCVRDPVGESHQARGQERGGARQETDSDQGAADQLDEPCRP